MLTDDAFKIAARLARRDTLPDDASGDTDTLFADAATVIRRLTDERDQLSTETARLKAENQPLSAAEQDAVFDRWDATDPKMQKQIVAKFLLHQKRLLNSLRDERNLCEVATQEVERLRTAVRKHRDQRGDDRCYLNDRELYATLPEGYTPPAYDTAVTLEQCAKFIACRQDPATEYVSPQREIERLIRDNAELLAERNHFSDTLVRLQNESGRDATLREVVADHAAIAAERDRLTKRNVELLAACKAVLSSPKFGDTPSPEAIAMVELAIAKAEGKCHQPNLLREDQGR